MWVQPADQFAKKKVAHNLVQLFFVFVFLILFLQSLSSYHFLSPPPLGPLVLLSSRLNHSPPLPANNKKAKQKITRRRPRTHFFNLSAEISLGLF
jgi:hypothetical protein